MFLVLSNDKFMLNNFHAVYRTGTKLLIFISVFFWHSGYARVIGNDQILIVLSFAGFGQERFKESYVPFLYKLSKNGVSSGEGLKPVFPSKTIPNQFSIATGLWVETHGVTSGSLFDIKLRKKVQNSKELYQSNNKVLPIWILNQLEGGISGCFMWPGSEFTYHNTRCTYHEPFRESATMLDIISTIEGWLTSANSPANLIMAFFHQPEKACKLFGISSKEANKKHKDIDEMIKYLFQKISRLGLKRRVNYVILGDHGNVPVSKFHLLNINPFLENDTYKVYSESPVLQIVPEYGYFDQVTKELEKARTELGHFKIYNETNFPKHWHVNTYRMGPISLVADKDYAFQDVTHLIRDYVRRYKSETNRTISLSGYETDHHEIDGVFVGYGPSFKKGHKMRQMEAVDVFPVFLHILDIDEVAPHNGSNVFNESIAPKSTASLLAFFIFLIITIGGAIVAIYFFIPNEGRKDIVLW